MTDAFAALDYCYLTTIGRVSGDPHEIEIWFGLRDGVVYLLSGGGEGSDWVKNLRADPQVMIRIGDEHRTAVARDVADPDENALARRLLVEKYRRSSNGLEEWGRSSLPIAIGWADGSVVMRQAGD